MVTVPDRGAFPVETLHIYPIYWTLTISVPSRLCTMFETVGTARLISDIFGLLIQHKLFGVHFTSITRSGARVGLCDTSAALFKILQPWNQVLFGALQNTGQPRGFRPLKPLNGVRIYSSCLMTAYSHSARHGPIILKRAGLTVPFIKPPAH